MPHYMYGDESLTQAVLGLEPNFTKHRTVIYFEPLTGLPVKANKRVQLSAKTMRDESIEYNLFYLRYHETGKFKKKF